MNPEPPLISASAEYAPLHDTADHRPWYSTPRARLFGAVFTVTLITGLILTLLQPTVYRSSATVLMTAAIAIDNKSAVASVQRVAIQRRILLGGEVTSRLLDTLHQEGVTAPDPAYLREVLQVIAVPNTDLVEMAAQGTEADLLPVIVNAWIDMYLNIRASHVEQSQQQTLQVVEDQLEGLSTKLDRARTALADYRDEHEISSAEREENEELSRLEGLNQALNTAVEKEITSQAWTEGLRKAIAENKEVVPRSERGHMDAMDKELSTLKSRLKNLQKDYTRDFITRNPKWRDIPVRIAELEAERASILEEGKYEVLEQAEQRLEANKQSVQDLEIRLNEQQEKAAHFTTVYATHQALVEDLTELERLNREAQSRLVRVEVNQVQKYPQVSVIDRPAAQSLRMGPDYRLWLVGTALVALAFGILAVWLYGFLGPREKPSFVTLSGVHMYPQDVSALSHDQQAQTRLAQASAPLLQHNTADDDVADVDDNDKEKT
ncbi:MAG: succinoglycan biosynthesis transport protein ExoP [Bacteroidia bacterium]|jgi:succinoglycan biosynthesis transport protein ExoP